MNKTKLSLALMLIAGAFMAGNLPACSKSTDATGAAGSSAGGTTGAAGTGAAGTGAGGANPAAKADGTCVTGAYKRGTPPACACQDGMPDVCTGACTTKLLDNANCGACGTACGLTAACNAGACGGAPTVMPAITGCTALTLASAGGAVYYADEGHGTINKVGGTASLVPAPEAAPTWLAAVGTNLFWYSKTNKTIRMAPAAGGAATTLYTNTMTAAPDAGAPPAIGGFATDGTSLYVSISTEVLKVLVAAPSTAPTVVAVEKKLGLPRAIAIVSATQIVFPTELNADVDAPMIGGAPTTPGSCGEEDAQGNVIMTNCPRLARSQGELLDTSIYAANATAYWVDGQNVKSEAVANTAGTFTTVAMSNGSGTITAFTLDGTTIYFTEDGLVEKTALAMNSTPVTMVRGQMAPTSIVSDGTKVWWATADCAIGSTAK